MKKASFFLIIAICIALASPIINALAVTDVYFTVVNDRLLDLNDETMPVKIGNEIYVPLLVFSQYTLSTYALYDQDKRIATIYSNDRSISFELGSGNTYDNKGKVYTFTATYYNSGVYIPAIHTSQFFGFKFSENFNDVSKFIRIKNSNADISDDDFAKRAALKMRSMLNVYNTKYSPSPTPVYTPTPTPTPAPSVSPGTSDRYSYVYMSVHGIGSSTASILSSLSYYGYKACFFVTAEEIRQYPDLIRRIIGSGQGIGIECSQNISQDYNEASILLREAANVKSLIIALDCGYTSDLGNAAKSQGLIIWNDSRLTIYGYNSDISTYTLDRIIKNAGNRLDLAFSGDSLSLIREALEDIDTYNYYVSTINETENSWLNAA